MEIDYFYSTNSTWVEFIYDYGESGDAKPKKKDARVQTSMYDIFNFCPKIRIIPSKQKSKSTIYDMKKKVLSLF